MKESKSRKKISEYKHISHDFEPIYDKNSNTLILGSFPSVISREQGFFYGNPRNRFWNIIETIYGETEPTDSSPQELIEFKKQLIIRHNLALYDTIEECDIVGSADVSIKNVTPANISFIINKSSITRVFVNGKTAEKYYKRYHEKITGIKAIVLPSTSPANAAWSYERLLEKWKENLASGK